MGRPLNSTNLSSYSYRSADCKCAHEYLLPVLASVLKELDVAPKQAFDLGCGNGSVASWLGTQGYAASGVDPSESGIAAANRAYPSLDLRVGSTHDPLREWFGTFPLLVSLEVVEHVYAPHEFARSVADLLSPNGYALISTPYHGYLKNLLLATTGRLDSHFTALWEHGHIKFWSRRTITTLLSQAGLNVLEIKRIGRVPQLAKTMLVIAQKNQ